MNLNIPDMIWAAVNLLFIFGIIFIVLNFIRLPGTVKDIEKRIDEIERKLEKIIENDEDI